MSKKPEPQHAASVTHHEDRLKAMQEQFAKTQEADAAAEKQRTEAQAHQDKATREEHIKTLEKQHSLVHETDTREAIMDKIRAMRDERQGEPIPLGHTEESMQQLTAEQEAGRAAVKRAEAEQERTRQLRERLAAEEMAKMREVHHPNPSQHEQFPATDATLGPKHK
jgi:hypothetical protein